MTQKSPPGRPVLPLEAEEEILNTLFSNMKISSGEIAAILKGNNRKLNKQSNYSSRVKSFN